MNIPNSTFERLINILDTFEIQGRIQGMGTYTRIDLDEENLERLVNILDECEEMVGAFPEKSGYEDWSSYK